jgi:hypothetical protein
MRRKQMTMNNADALRKELRIDENLRYFEKCVETGKLTREGQQRLKVCLEAAILIDPKTAEVKSEYGAFLDPYGVFQNKKGSKRLYYARSPGGDIWVYWDDLPYEVQCSLWRKHKKADPALGDPLSCWASFCYSAFFRKDVPDDQITENHVTYLRLIIVGPFSGREARQLKCSQSVAVKPAKHATKRKQ